MARLLTIHIIMLHVSRNWSFELFMLWKAIFMCQFYGLVLRGNLVSWKESFLKYSRTVIN